MKERGRIQPYTDMPAQPFPESALMVDEPYRGIALHKNLKRWLFRENEGFEVYSQNPSRIEWRHGGLTLRSRFPLPLGGPSVTGREMSRDEAQGFLTDVQAQLEQEENPILKDLLGKAQSYFQEHYPEPSEPAQQS